MLIYILSKNLQNDNHIGVLRANIADVVMLMFGAVCQQGSPVELKGK